MFVLPYVESVKSVLGSMAPGMPPEYWWVTAGVLFILALAATIDAFTTVIPDVLIFLGLVAVTSVQGFFVSWDIAALYLREAIGAGLAIWFINFAWHWKFGYDALGMGDAKWTMLAAACFGIAPAVYAWGIGSVLATILILTLRLFKYRVAAVTFSPFLFIGLGVALFALRFW